MLIFIGTLSVLTLGIAGVAVPTVLTIRKLVGQIEEEEKKIDTRYALRRYIRSSLANLIETKKDLGQLSDVALQEGKELAFITAVEDAANAAGVEHKIVLETANQKEISPWEREIPVKLEAEGPYPAVLRFLNDVERLPYYVLVESIHIATPRAGSELSGEGLVEGLIQGKVYWQASSAPDFVHGKAAEEMMLTPEEGESL